MSILGSQLVFFGLSKVLNPWDPAAFDVFAMLDHEISRYWHQMQGRRQSLLISCHMVVDDLQDPLQLLFFKVYLVLLYAENYGCQCRIRQYLDNQTHVLLHQRCRLELGVR